MQKYILGYINGSRWYGAVSTYVGQDKLSCDKFRISASSYREAGYQTLFHAIHEASSRLLTIYTSDKYLVLEVRGEVQPAHNHIEIVDRIRTQFSAHPEWKIEWQHADYMKRFLPKIPYQGWR